MSKELMTVGDMIDALQKIENKNASLCLFINSEGMRYDIFTDSICDAWLNEEDVLDIYIESI